MRSVDRAPVIRLSRTTASSVDDCDVNHNFRVLKDDMTWPAWRGYKSALSPHYVHRNGSQGSTIIIYSVLYSSTVVGAVVFPVTPGNRIASGAGVFPVTQGNGSAVGAGVFLVTPRQPNLTGILLST